MHRAFAGNIAADEDIEQSRLACAVGADQRDASLLWDFDADVPEDVIRPVGFGEIVRGQNGHDESSNR